MARIWKYTGLLMIAVLALGTALVAVGHSVQADAPSDNVTSPMVQAGSEPVSQQNGCNNTNDGGVLESTSTYVMVEVDCWHEGHCQVCEEDSDYSCSPNEYCWISPCPFVDPVPPDNTVTKIDAEVRGVPCTEPGFTSAFIKVHVNDTLVGEGLETGNCYCDECWPLSVSSATYVAGFPGYVYGGDNNLSLDINGSSCISNVYVTLYYQAMNPSPTPKVSPPLSRPYNPPQMSVQYLSVNPNQTAADQPVTIAANVVNTGDQAGNLNIALKINGQVEETRMVSVGPQATQPVKFTISKSEPGTYAVDILGQEGSFTVFDPGANAREPMNGAMIALLAMGILAVVVAVLIIRSYRRTAN
jgi:hypothetical protein